ncbi:MAG TPA: hypothetical protein VMV40_06930 [Acidiferrobacter sp.]|nr:hypothetical protein [Acidiferrobacter sp.]
MKKTTTTRQVRTAGSLIGAALVLLSVKAYAVPSFARQTGLPCAVCHDVPPQLTAFGQQFKLDGYVMTSLKQVAAGTNGDDLSINRVPPLSVMLQLSSDTLTSPGTSNAGNQNTTALFPEQLSLFYAGEITPHIGAFMQVTAANGGGFGMDNTDVRYARQSVIGGQSVAWGIDTNNNPTVEDLWNTTPAWGFPWANGASPSNAPLINGLGTNVAGIGEYSMWNNTWYEDVSFYRTAVAGNGNGNADAGSISGVAPYWRLAWQHNFGKSSLEVGTYGIEARYVDGMSATPANGAADRYTDTALDSQFKHHFGTDLLTVYAVAMHEHQDLSSSYAASGSSVPSANLNNESLTGTYQFGAHYQVGASYFNSSGTSNPLYYTTSASATGNPSSNGETIQVTYLPWQNTQFTLQYSAYNKVNGSTSGADQANNIYLLGWFLW